MWIKTQYKGLIQKFDAICINGDYVYGFVNTGTDESIQLGKYDSKERAIEVYEDIQNHFNSIELNKLKALAGLMDWDSFVGCSTTIFEMPEN